MSYFEKAFDYAMTNYVENDEFEACQDGYITGAEEEEAIEKAWKFIISHYPSSSLSNSGDVRYGYDVGFTGEDFYNYFKL